MIVIGVDPGLTGALAILDSTRGLLDCIDLPVCPNGQVTGKMKTWLDVRALQLALDERAERFGFVQGQVRCCMERPIAMPTLPAQTIASQFDTFGALRTVLQALGHLELVGPKEWKGFFGLGNDKAQSRECCLRLYPSAPVARVKDHNRAEAVLIGHWMLRRYVPSSPVASEDLMGAF